MRQSCHTPFRSGDSIRNTKTWTFQQQAFEPPQLKSTWVSRERTESVARERIDVLIGKMQRTPAHKMLVVATYGSKQMPFVQSSMRPAQDASLQEQELPYSHIFPHTQQLSEVLLQDLAQIEFVRVYQSFPYSVVVVTTNRTIRKRS